MRMRLFTCSALAALILTGAAASAQTAPGQPAATAADSRFKALYEKEWAWRQAEFGDTDDDAVRALVAAKVNDMVEAMVAHENGDISDDAAQFRIDTTVEDFVHMLMGTENDDA